MSPENGMFCFLGSRDALVWGAYADIISSRGSLPCLPRDTPLPPPRKTISSKTFLLGHSPCSLGSLHLSWGVEHCGLLAGSLLISPQVPRLLGESV